MGSGHTVKIVRERKSVKRKNDKNEIDIERRMKAVTNAMLKMHARIRHLEAVLKVKVKVKPSDEDRYDRPRKIE